MEVENQPAVIGGEVTQEQDFDSMVSESRGQARTDKATATDGAPKPATATDTTKAQAVTEAKSEKPEAPKSRTERRGDRYSENVRRREDAERRSMQLEKELAELKKNPAPKREDYAHDADYLTDAVKRGTSETVMERESQRAKQHAAEASNTAYVERIRDQIGDENFEAFSILHDKHVGDLSGDRLTADYIVKSEHGPLMLKELFNAFEQNPMSKATFLSMPEAKRSVILYDLERFVSQPQQAQPVVQQRSNAPQPVVPESRSSTGVDTDDFDQMVNRHTKRR